MHNSPIQFLKSFILVAVLILSCNIIHTNSQNCLNKVITRVVCENTNPIISCYSTRIRLLSVYYGRYDTTTCPGPIQYINCFQDATSTVMSICNETTSCTFSISNALVNHNDPCPGTVKYAVINYLCY